MRFILFLFFGPLLLAQSSATLSGRILDPGGAAVEGARVTLDQPLTGLQRHAIAQDGGTFLFPNIPWQTYRLRVEAAGFETAVRELSLRSNVPVSISISLEVERRREGMTVGAYETTALLDTEATGARTAINLEVIEHMPLPASNRGIESVLLSFPGFAKNANGAIHPRGAHNQMTYVVDGMPISDQLTGAFASSLDSNIVQNVELFTGDVPAEFGAKVSGVANITTRTGLGTGRRATGSIQTNVAGFDTLSNVAQFAGEGARTGYFASFFTFKSHRYLDQVSIDNLHNGGNSERGFARIDYQMSAQDTLQFHLMGGRSSFELSNLRSQQWAGQDQRQLLRDAAGWAGWLRTLGPAATIDVTAAYRTSIAQLFPSAGDRPVTAAQARHLSTFTLAGNYNRMAGPHRIRAGVSYQRFPVSENFSFGITDPLFNDPAQDIFRPTLQPHDLSRGGKLFEFSGKAGGSFSTAFLQDSIKWDRFVFSIGWRYDAYRFLAKGAQLQPRLGMAFHLRETGTVLRVSYNRNYQTPPNENLLLSSSPQARLLAPESVRQALENALVPIRPERQNVYEAGLQQALFRRASLSGSFYHKDSSDQQDNDNFLNTGIIFPVTLKKIRVNGAELRLTLPLGKDTFSSISVTHSHAVSTPPFTGGVFLSQGAVDLLSAGPFVIDHDQKLAVQGNFQHTFRKHFWCSGSVRYDSGLVANASDPARVANDPDYYDLLAYVNLTSAPPRVRPRIIADAAVGYERLREGRLRWDAQVQITNITNRTALYNFQSVFVGTRLVEPRTAGVKVRWHW